MKRDQRTSQWTIFQKFNKTSENGHRDVGFYKDTKMQSMQRLVFVLIIGLRLPLPGDTAARDTPATMDAEALLELAPRISLQEATISTFDVKGTMDINGHHLRFIVSGKQPDLVAIQIIDPRDGTPIMIGVGNAFMLYDPVVSEVLLGSATSSFILSVEKDPDKVCEANPDGQNVVLGFGFNTMKNTVIDIHSFLSSLVTPLEVVTQDSLHYTMVGETEKGNRAKAYITPTRSESPYSKIELYQAGSEKPFLVLDAIVMNQAIPETRFILPKEKLRASTLPIRELPASGRPVEMVLSTGIIARAILARLVLAGLDDTDLKLTVERMSPGKLNWEDMKRNDKIAGAILRSILQDNIPQPTEQ